MTDKSFHPELAELLHAMSLLLDSAHSEVTEHLSLDGALTRHMPEQGVGERATLEYLAPIVLDGAARLGSDTAFAHMDPPTPWITWVTHCWNASLNQNLLHPDVSPVAGELEHCLMQWLVPYFGMAGGHLTPGSTVSNLTALWAARDQLGVKRVVASTSAHVSIDKAARILGLELIKVPVMRSGQINESLLPINLDDAALVLTAGTTSEGAIDSFASIGKAAWTHIDAAWAGPLRFSSKHSDILAGIEQADSVAMSAHKWLFQPKECGVLMFRDVLSANKVLSVNGVYLTKPNVGLLGSHGASAIPLLATLINWGREGLAQRIDAAMNNSDLLLAFLIQYDHVHVFGENNCGVVLWRSSRKSTVEILNALPLGSASITRMGDTDWVRHVSANPNIDMDLLRSAIASIL